MDINWLSLLYDAQFKAILDKKAEKTFVDDSATQEEAVSYVLEKLSEDSWAMCKKHQGLVSPEAYLMTLCSNLLVEFSRKKYGRARPPEWLKRQGAFWITLWQELCLKRADETLVLERHRNSGEREASSIEIIIRTIKAKLPWCGVSNRPESVDDDSSTDKNIAQDEATIEANLHRDRYDQFLLIAQLMLGDEASQTNVLVNEQENITRLVQSLDLSAEERLMLRMHYVDGLSHSAIARKLNVAKHIPVRQNKKVLQRLLALLEEHGIELDIEN